MLNTPYQRQQRMAENTKAKISTIKFYCVLGLLMACLMAFAVRFTCLGIVSLYKTVHQVEGNQ